MSTLGLKILHEDYHCIAVAKPAGLLTQGPPGVPNLESLVKAYIKQRYAKPGNVYLGIPHRLDRPVSGVVLFARNTKAAQRIAVQFQTHAVHKIYWAVVHGRPQPPHGQWQDWLRKLPQEARVEIVTAEEPGAKPAVLTYDVLGEIQGRFSMLQLQPQTGRMHQLRIQCARRGYPIRGDRLYGSRATFGPSCAGPRDQPIALHARGLTFTHPVERRPMTCVAPLPAWWVPVLYQNRGNFPAEG